MIKFLMSKSSYTMTYFHPHDFDSDRPIVGSLSHFNKFKSKVGLNNSLKKMEKMIQEFHFIDLEEAVKRVDWDNVKVISLPERRNIQRLDEI